MHGFAGPEHTGTVDHVATCCLNHHFAPYAAMSHPAAPTRTPLMCEQVWDLKDLGLQAAQRVVQAADPLALLTEISQNFPALVSSLSREKVCVWGAGEEWG